MGVLVVAALLSGVAALVIGRMTSPVRPAVGAAGMGEGRHPVVLIAGVMSRGAGFARLTAALQRKGTPVLDFDPAAPGTQPFTLAPVAADQHIGDVAATMLQPAVEAALRRAGYDQERQHVDVVAHSVGGLLARFLVERPGGPVDPTWAARVDDLVMVATPNHGSAFGSWLARTEHHANWNGIAGDFQPRSPFLTDLGTAEPAGEVYTVIGGEAWPLNWLRSDDDGDGRSHGHDGVVPAESPALTGAPLAIEPRSHGRLLPDRRVIERITATLRATNA
ncbi:MAG: esterase/lipase family protein [Acidimicrobiales bacterium]